jgi:RNA-directed DNA polymerase
MSKAKSFNIPKQVVYNAYKRVKENKGAAGIDNQTIKDCLIILTISYL